MADESDDGNAPGPVSAGEHLRAHFRRLGLDQGDVAKAIGVSRQSINNIINGRSPISLAMARKLAALTGHDPGFWLQARFPSDDETALATAAGEHFAAFVSRLPLNEAAAAGSAIRALAGADAFRSWTELRAALDRTGASPAVIIGARLLWRLYLRSAVWPARTSERQ